MTTNEAASRALIERLEELEEAATAPCVPGEAEAWCRALAESVARVASLEEASVAEQEAVCRQILDEDPGFAHRVAQIRRRNARSRDALRRLRRRLTALTGRAARGEEPAQELEELREEVVAWVAQRRARKAELEAWLLESVYRDEGLGG